MSLLKFVLRKNHGQEDNSKDNEVTESDATDLQRKTGRGKGLGKYTNFTSGQRYKIGRYAAEFGNKWAVIKYNVGESTVCLFKK